MADVSRTPPEVPSRVERARRRREVRAERGFGLAFAVALAATAAYVFWRSPWSGVWPGR
ncbi:MAG: hypothetical protein K6U14_07760 [Firmicutes bacterium]|nr:hypothetical protein [Alicyclobacillaceae bacterium]MCL6497511.1 hypothetical protein [Bacillota bacterium]